MHSHYRNFQKHQKMSLKQSTFSKILTKTQESPRHNNTSFKGSSSSNLLSELNMTYSRLTQYKQDRIIQRPYPSSAFQQKYPNSTTNQQEKRCSNCRKLQKLLFNLQNFLLQLEDKFIRKQSELQSKFQQILVDQKTKYKSQIIELKSILNNNGVDYFSHQKKTNEKCLLNQQQQEEQSLSSSALQQKANKIKRNKQHKKFTCHVPIQKNQYNSKKTQSNFEMTKATQESSRDDVYTASTMLINSNASNYNSQSPQRYQQQHYQLGSFELSSSRKQLEPIQNINQLSKIPKKSLMHQRQQQRQQQQWQEQSDEERTKFSIQDLTISKLRFQNQNLNNYNQVLLSKIRPKSIADRVFNI